MQVVSDRKIGHSTRSGLAACLAIFVGLAVVLTTIGADVAQAAKKPPKPPAQALKEFVAASDRGDIPAILALYEKYAAQNSKQGALAVLYAGLHYKVTQFLSEKQTKQLFKAAEASLLQMTDKKARKEMYKAVRKHPEWRARAMLLNIAHTRFHEEKRAEKAILMALTDYIDAVSIRAIEMSMELGIERAVPRLIKLVVDKWGQHVGLGAAKAKMALERLTGHQKPTGWYEWVRQNM
jgi:hypothetical protein